MSANIDDYKQNYVHPVKYDVTPDPSTFSKYMVHSCKYIVPEGIAYPSAIS